MSDICIVKLPVKNVFPDISLYHLLPENRIRKLERYSKAVDRLRCYTAGLAAVKISATLTSGNTADIQLVSTNGKPPYSICENKLVRLSISHSGRYVAVIADHTPCGIDTEEIHTSSAIIHIARKFFHHDEWKKLDSLSDMVIKSNYFYFLWTMKEAYLKYLGTGLSKPLDSFCIEYSEKGIFVYDRNDTIPVSLKTLHFLVGDNCFSVVSRSSINSITQLEYDELISSLKS